MKKRIITMALAVIMLLAVLTGCGDNASNPGNDTPTTQVVKLSVGTGAVGGSVYTTGSGWANVMNNVLAGRYELTAERCGICGRQATNCHHLVPRRCGDFALVTPRGTWRLRSPLIALCGRLHRYRFLDQWCQVSKASGHVHLRYAQPLPLHSGRLRHHHSA